MNYSGIDDFKDRDEQALWVGKPAFVIFVFSGAHYLLATAFGWMFMAGVFEFAKNVPIRNETENLLATIFYSLFYLPAAIPFFYFLMRIAGYKNIQYAVTNKKVLHRRANKQIASLPISEIEKVVVFQDPVLKYLGLGHLIIGKKMEIGNSQKMVLQFLCVRNPKKIRDTIRSMTSNVTFEGNLAA